jgi:GxxExxY protein
MMFFLILNRKRYSMESKHYERQEELMKVIYQSALKVHSALGPGLLESVYEVCLLHELTKRGLLVERQKLLPIAYDGMIIDSGLRLDLIVEREIIIELKSVESLIPVHQAQILTYMKLAKKELGYLMNFNEKLLRNGVKRFTLRGNIDQ